MHTLKLNLMSMQNKDSDKDLDKDTQNKDVKNGCCGDGDECC